MTIFIAFVPSLYTLIDVFSCYWILVLPVFVYKMATLIKEQLKVNNIIIIINIIAMINIFVIFVEIRIMSIFIIILDYFYHSCCCCLWY